MPYILIYFLCLLRSKFWADRYSKNDLTFLLCKVIYRCKKAGARDIASAFEIFISSNCQRLLYSKGQKFHSINKASNGTRSYGEIVIKGSTKPFISRAFCFQQPLQNHVPRVQVLLPLPKKAPNFRCFFPLFTLFHGVFTCFSHIDKIMAHGLFRTPIFHYCTVFCSLCATQSTQSVWFIIKKASITSQIR